MASSNAGTLVSCDWNPFLLKVPELIHQLGYCAALAATREAAQIKLSGHNIEYPGLATNLVAVTSQGQDAFLKEYSDMLQIASKTNNMGKIGGILDQVVERFSDASAERSTKRLLDRLQSDINACDASGKRTNEDFQLWQEKFRSVRIAVHGAQNALLQSLPPLLVYLICNIEVLTLRNLKKAETHENLAKTENTMTSLGAHMARTYIDLDKAQNEKDVAQKKHEEALIKQQEREAELNSIAAQAGRMSLAFSFGMVGVVAGVGASLYLSASAAGTVAKAEAELERQRQKARDLDYGLQTVAVELKLFAHENQGLGVLMQAIVKVLTILDELTDNIKELIIYFARINNEIRNLVAEHESQVKKIAQEKANGIQVEDVDYVDFQTSALEMKKHSLNIHALSTLYSTVITEVINPGFSLALKSSHHTEGSSALVVAHKEEGLKKYLADAEKFCSKSSLKANQTLLDRHDELDREQQRQRPRRAAASLPPAITSGTGPDTGRNSRFSRLNPFRRDR